MGTSLKLCLCGGCGGGPAPRGTLSECGTRGPLRDLGKCAPPAGTGAGDRALPRGLPEGEHVPEVRTWAWPAPWTGLSLSPAGWGLAGPGRTPAGVGSAICRGEGAWNLCSQAPEGEAGGLAEAPARVPGAGRGLSTKDSLGAQLPGGYRASTWTAGPDRCRVSAGGPSVLSQVGNPPQQTPGRALGQGPPGFRGLPG